MATTYQINKVNGDTVETLDTRTRKSDAEKLARETNASERVAVQVVTDKGTVVFDFAAPAADAVLRTKPYTRVEQPTFELAEGVSLPEGYTVAYTRKQTGLLVLRADDNSGYLVFDANTGDSTAAENTTETRHIMREKLAEKRAQDAAQRAADKEKSAKERAEAKAERDKAKAEAEAERKAAAEARDKARAEKKAADEAEREAKRKAREEAAAAKAKAKADAEAAAEAAKAKESAPAEVEVEAIEA